jgi:hypothetical protein
MEISTLFNGSESEAFDVYVSVSSTSFGAAAKRAKTNLLSHFL